jgi:hypothetical protein
MEQGEIKNLSKSFEDFLQEVSTVEYDPSRGERDYWHRASTALSVYERQH